MFSCYCSLKCFCGWMKTQRLSLLCFKDSPSVWSAGARGRRGRPRPRSSTVFSLARPCRGAETPPRFACVCGLSVGTRLHQSTELSLTFPFRSLFFPFFLSTFLCAIITGKKQTVFLRCSVALKCARARTLSLENEINTWKETKISCQNYSTVK